MAPFTLDLSIKSIDILLSRLFPRSDMSHDVEIIYALFLWCTYYEVYVTILGNNGWGSRVHCV